MTATIPIPPDLTADDRADAAALGVPVFDQPDIDEYARTHQRELDKAALDRAYLTLPEHESKALSRLVISGEVTENSPSDADSHLFRLLAVSGIRDAAQLERLGRDSEIANQCEMWVGGRPGSTEQRARKWARHDYIPRTIANALAATEREYRKRQALGAAVTGAGTVD